MDEQIILRNHYAKLNIEYFIHKFNRLEHNTQLPQKIHYIFVV